MNLTLVPTDMAVTATQQSILLEEPREVDVIAIERELALLWKQAAEEGEPGGPVVRACSLNLVVVTESSARLSAVEQLVGEVTLEHPARIFLIQAARASMTSQLEAWISARCSLPVPGGTQVCCEQISLNARGADVEKIPSVVASLLVPDIPSVLLWKTDVRPGRGILESLADQVDRVLIDSSEEEDPAALLRAWQATAVAHHREREFGDLSWSHLTPWRLALAQPFESAEMRRHLESVSRVGIAYSSTADPEHSGLSQSFLLVSWLSDRLGWSINAPATGTPEHGFHASAGGSGGIIDIAFSPRASGRPGPGGIEEVSLTFAPGVSLTLSSGEDRSCIRSEIRLPGRETTNAVLRARDRDESAVLAQELDRLDGDPLEVAAGRNIMALLGGVQ